MVSNRYLVLCIVEAGTDADVKLQGEVVHAPCDGIFTIGLLHVLNSHSDQRPNIQLNGAI
jgi:hypothetical protein